MKLNEFIHLEEVCPKCNNTLMLQKNTWSDMSGALYYVFCEPCHCKGNGANEKEIALEKFHKELARKEKLDRQKPKAILTDICNYLEKSKGNWQERNKIMGFELSETMANVAIDCWIDKALADLAEYAKKLGVDL